MVGEGGGTLWVKGSSRCRVSGSVGNGLVLFEPRPLARGVVHFEDGVDQHCGAARAVSFRQNLRVLTQLDLDDVTLLWTRVFCKNTKKKQRTGQNYKYFVITVSFQGLKFNWLQLTKNQFVPLRITVCDGWSKCFVLNSPIYFLLTFVNNKNVTINWKLLCNFRLTDYC